VAYKPVDGTPLLPYHRLLDCTLSTHSLYWSMSANCRASCQSQQMDD